MRKRNEPFWDILMCKPLVCSVYHIMTERADVTAAELCGLPALPSTIIADNALYYGEYEIIGHLPITDHEDYPILYGDSIHIGDSAVCYQCGRVFRRLENQTQRYDGFLNNGVGFLLNVRQSILQQCIDTQSNTPYWSLYHQYEVDRDLRNPKFAEKLRQVRRQFGL